VECYATGTPVCRHKVSDAPQTSTKHCTFARYSYKRHFLSFIIDSFIQHVLCFVFICLHSYRASIYMQIHIYGHVWVSIVSYPLFCEATVCDVPSCVFDKYGCAAGETMMRNTGLVKEAGIPQSAQWLGYWLDNQGSIPSRDRSFFLLATASKPALRGNPPPPPHIQCEPEGKGDVEWSWPPLSSAVKEWSYTSTTPHVLWRGS
jgi:hypothetical protein